QTVIMNSAKEPEIIDLANFINSLGGKIRGAGTSTIIIDGVAELGGGEYTPIPDRIITGTYLIAGAMTKGNIKLTNANYQDVYALLNKLRNAGAKIDYDNNSISLSCDKRPLACASIESQPFPGFPTDLQAQILALQTISDGISIITENLFETRFKHVPELLKMGAKITIKDRMAIVRGVQTLRGVEVFAGDLRGGASLVLAGLVADGITKVYNPHFIDRGYEDFEYKLRSLGANIKREMR
ncbi:MAG: UDP-N-acetylglucosamine 1-carboxyvinyltransferase, partial [Clostridia bacterium]|nr:UDP-N-acetylglucosamine 1-carboxyvinyltransferase [Clostridia bacterium]